MPVFAPTHSHVPAAADRGPSADWGAMFDVLIVPGEPSRRLREELVQALKEKRYRTVILRKNFLGQDLFPYDQLLNNYQAYPLDSQNVIVYKPKD